MEPCATKCTNKAKGKKGIFNDISGIKMTSSVLGVLDAGLKEEFVVVMVVQNVLRHAQDSVAARIQNQNV